MQILFKKNDFLISNLINCFLKPWFVVSFSTLTSEHYLIAQWYHCIPKRLMSGLTLVNTLCINMSLFPLDLNDESMWSLPNRGLFNQSVDTRTWAVAMSSLRKSDALQIAHNFKKSNALLYFFTSCRKQFITLPVTSLLHHSATSPEMHCRVIVSYQYNAKLYAL